MHKKSFTLIELIIVIAIIAVLAGAMMPLFKRSQDDAKIAKAKQELETLKTALRLFSADTGYYPRPSGWDITTIGICLLSNESVPGWNGPYLEENIVTEKTDPWGIRYNAYEYSKGLSGSCNYQQIGSCYLMPNNCVYGIKLLSNGPDRQKDTADDIVIIAK